MRVPFRLRHISAVVALAFAAPAFAQFNPGPNPITGTVGAQTLSSGTGTINAGGAISVSGGTLALNMTGSSTLVNNGTIQTTGSGRAIDSNSGIAALNLTNTGLISSNTSDAFRVNTNSTVELLNSGTIQVTNGGQAIDWAAIGSATNKLTNQSGGLISAVGEDAVRPGTIGVVINAGTITATPTGGSSPTGSDGIDLRTEKNVTVTNTGTISGRHGIATDGANVGPSSLKLDNNGGVIQALNGSGVNIDGVSVNVTANITNLAGATIKGGVLAVATAGDGDGIDVDGKLTLINSGDVLGLGAKGPAMGPSNNAEGIAAGGGTITNNVTGRIIGSTLAADAPGGDPTKAGNGILIDDSSGGNAIAKTVIENSGLIEGKSGFAIKMIGTFDNSVTNNTGGIIRGTGLGAGAALQSGDGPDTIVNKGTIVGGNGSALDLQGGNDRLTIEGGAASISGNISGGLGDDTISFDLGLGKIFSYSDSLSEFSTVEIKSGTANLTGANNYSGAKLALAGGTFATTGAGGDNGKTFASLELTESSTIDLKNSTSLTFKKLGTVPAGKMLAVLNYDETDSPDYVFRLVGDFSTNADFLSLISRTTIDGRVARFNVEGGFTNVTVPEPPTYAVLGLGGILLLAFRRRRRRG